MESFVTNIKKWALTKAHNLSAILAPFWEELELGLKPVKAYEIDEAFFQQFRG
jgi:hypothetical protein